jgi:hypothetical protein
VRRGAFLAVFTGALLFGVGHALLMPIGGIIFSDTPWLLPLGFVAGLGLCLALYAQPRAGTMLRVRGWLLRLTGAALTFVLVQLTFNFLTGPDTGTALSWMRSKYERSFEPSTLTRGKSMIEALIGASPCRNSDGSLEYYPCWADYLTLADAVLIGIALFVGITFGLSLARKYLSRHRVEAEYLGE